VQAIQRSGPLDLILRRYIAFSLRSAYQAVACNALHAAEERMSRWLLTTQDRVGKGEFLLTQEFLAEMLGVRRQTVQVVAGTLRTAGLITYRRGWSGSLIGRGWKPPVVSATGSPRRSTTASCSNHPGREEKWPVALRTTSKARKIVSSLLARTFSLCPVSGIVFAILFLDS
jgi:hypothetical protein